MLADAIGLAELVDQLLRHRGRFARLGNLLQQHAELVAADARDKVVAAHAGAQPRGDHLEEPVSDVVPQAVVHLLEVVEIDEQHRHGLVVTPRVRHRLAGALVEHRPVGQPGQRVVVREKLEASRVVLQLDGGEAQVFLSALQRRDVVAQHVEAEHRAAGRQVRHAGHLQRALAGSLGAVELELELDLLAGEHALEMRLHARVVLLAEHLRDAAPEQALLRDAEPVVVGAVAGAEARLAVEVGDERRHVVRDQAQPLFALAQGLLHFRGAQHRAAGDQHRDREQGGGAGHQHVEQHARRPGRAREPAAQPVRDLGARGDDEHQRAEDDEQGGERNQTADHRLINSPRRAIFTTPIRRCNGNIHAARPTL